LIDGVASEGREEVTNINDDVLIASCATCGAEKYECVTSGIGSRCGGCDCRDPREEQERGEECLFHIFLKFDFILW
jgi:hypothetical protein